MQLTLEIINEVVVDLTETDYTSANQMYSNFKIMYSAILSTTAIKAMSNQSLKCYPVVGVALHYLLELPLFML